MKRKFLKQIIWILLLIICLLLVLVVKISNIRDSKESFEYIISDKMDEETVSPSMIHVVLGLYKGDVDPKAISKSTYYFVNTVIPKYYQKYSSIEKAESYYDKYKEDIYLDTGIDNKEEFIKLINQINKIENSKIISSRFDKDYIIVTEDYLETILYVKLENDKEVSFKVIINNDYSLKTHFIKYSII